MQDDLDILEDGQIVINKPKKKVKGFYDNLALDYSDEELKKLSYDLIKKIKEDKESNRDWLDSMADIYKYLGFGIEEKVAPFPMACRTYDTTMSNALIRFFANTRSELLPETGPVGYKVVGETNEELDQIGKRRADYLNYYLTVEDQEFYKDFERTIFNIGFYGLSVRKVYKDHLKNKPVARFINPKDFIINRDCRSLRESTRLTHVLHLDTGEIILNIQNKIYRDVDLSYLKPNSDINRDVKDDEALSGYSRLSLYNIYEVHCNIALDDYFKDSEQVNLPMPYIIHIDEITEEVLSIQRNWKEDDERFTRINHFIEYGYLPGFDIFGIGLGRLAGSNAKSLTAMLRQLIDSATFKNLQGGFYKKGAIEFENTSMLVSPSTYIGIKCNDGNMQDNIMPLPFTEPSATMVQLMQDMIVATKELCSTSEMGMLDSKEDIATGTAMAFLETQNRVQSVVLKTIHAAFSQELQLLDEIFRETVQGEDLQSVDGSMRLTIEDYADDIRIIPVSDPASNSTVQKIMRAEAILNVAMQLPQIHNMPEVVKMVYKAQGLSESDIEKIMLPQQQEQEEQPVDLDKQILLADIEQKKEANVIREKIAQNNLMKDGFKAQMELEIAKLKADKDKEIALIKAELDLMKMQQV